MTKVTMLRTQLLTQPGSVPVADEKSRVQTYPESKITLQAAVS